MKAIGYRRAGSLERSDALIEFETDRPTPTGRDILVRVRAVSVNPVDYKIRQMREPQGAIPDILGWDAVGEVIETGPNASRFKAGDMVWYAGAIDRPGTNAEYHLVDERIVGHAPKTISATAAAALPLTAITAYEMLFDRLRVQDPVPGASPAVMIIGGSGGVGSIAIQLLRAKTDLDVIATASREATQSWVRELGAGHVVDHSKSLPPQIDALGIGAPGFVFSTNGTEAYLDAIAELIAPQGRFGFVDDPENIEISRFKSKSVSTHWEFMFTRSMFQTDDMAAQGRLLDEVADLIDSGSIQSTATQSLGPISVANLRKAHAMLESGKAKGKIVLEGM